MRDPLYSVRPQNGRHPFRAKNGETEKEHITVVRVDLPGIGKHTAAEGPKEPVTLYKVTASTCVREFLWRDPPAALRRATARKTVLQKTAT
jgi:hypothetical protein